MIKVHKLDEPPVLTNNRQRWTDEYVAAKNSGTLTKTIRYRYRHSEIKGRVCEETQNKCAYCESKITHTYPGDIEHILPSSQFPDQICEWRNLTLACGECNRRKLDYYSEQQPLINPYIADPKEHLIGAGPLIFGKPGDQLGTFAELKLELNRAPLVERRSERINALNNLANRYANEPEGELRTLLENELTKEMSKDIEYAFISRTFLKIACDLSYNAN